MKKSIAIFLTVILSILLIIILYPKTDNIQPSDPDPNKKDIKLSQSELKQEKNSASDAPRKSAQPTKSVGRGVSRNDDISLLARAIHAETKGEPYLGQVAVGAVMLNRVTHPAFPNTLAGVIYQPCAFEPRKSGSINEALNASAYNAARDALNGWDPTGGAIYFWNPSSATSGWIWTREVTLSIGKHVFAHD
ncbi:MAG TPA: cell wall hydrolase [Oscillospiraceae bacterium]|nr:cell wall hydrolase [Oscillospiraceae bacterium]